MGLKEQIEMYEQELVDLQFDHFDKKTAWEMGCAMVESIIDDNHPAVIDIKYKGQQVFRYAFEGSSVDNDIWITRKENTAIDTKESSILINLRMQRDNTESPVDQEKYAIWPGGFPIIVKSEGVVGSFTVSGVPGTGDHDIIADCIRKYLGK